MPPRRWQETSSRSECGRSKRDPAAQAPASRGRRETVLVLFNGHGGSISNYCSAARRKCAMFYPVFCPVFFSIICTAGQNLKQLYCPGRYKTAAIGLGILFISSSSYSLLGYTLSIFLPSLKASGYKSNGPNAM